MAGNWHESYVRSLGLPTRRFLRTLREAIGLDCDAEWPASVRYNPDAYEIDKEARHVTVYEVEIAHPIDEPQLRRILGTYFVVDCEGWSMSLVVVDRFLGRRERGDEHLWRLWRTLNRATLAPG